MFIIHCSFLFFDYLNLFAGKSTVQTIPYVSRIYINQVFEQDWIIGDRYYDIYVIIFCSID